MDNLRTIVWVGSSREDLKALPEAVQKDIGFTLHRIQEGDKPQNVKPLVGIGSGILEIISNYNTNTYRAVYAVKLGEYIYVLHVFQKKSKTGIKTPQQDIELIKRRFAIAKENAE